MKISELWLQEWIDPSLKKEDLYAKLTLCGLEVEGLTSVAEHFSDVVIGEITDVKVHPTADRLQVCTLNVKQNKSLTIVSGATNVKKGMKVPVALDKAVLPHEKKISITEIQGIRSDGMLCSASELDLSAENEGIFELPHDAPIGVSLWDYLNLTDRVVEIAITPNRGDCLSLLGIAKEIAAITATSFRMPITISPIKPFIQNQFNVAVSASKECPIYTARIIRNVKADASTPIWMQERLRRGGIRSISPVVDVMNYVMQELGQPMHAFDFNTLKGEIQVRLAHENETLNLLDGQTKQLIPGTLLIADQERPLAIAGVMGGLDSGVTLLTKDILLESAYFEPLSIMKSVRSYSLNSESAYRFERGIDPTLQEQAIERATALLLEITGGEPAPVIRIQKEDYIPKSKNIFLRRERIHKLLGVAIANSEVENSLQRLGCSLKAVDQGWNVEIPTRRSDIALEVDLIEEVSRLYGLEKIPEHQYSVPLTINAYPESKLTLATIRKMFSDLGYNEMITYSFIDKNLQKLFAPGVEPKELLNPITADMSVMRTTLWPGLVMALKYNLNRQQERARLFEIGLKFVESKQGLLQQPVISGLISGFNHPEQWGIHSREVDFFDLKGDLQNIFSLTRGSNQFNFLPGTHPALHPGQTAQILRNGNSVGWVGALHPSVVQKIDLSQRVFLFELEIENMIHKEAGLAQEISKFPEIRRDISILINQAVPSQQIQDTIKVECGDILKDIVLFDVYQGKGIPPEKKSVALGLILQQMNRTLRDEEVVEVLNRVIERLKNTFAAELRG